MLDARCWILDAGYSMLDARCWMVEKDRHSAFGIRCTAHEEWLKALKLKAQSNKAKSSKQ